MDEVGDAVDTELLAKSLDAVRHRVKHYRMYMKPSFQVQRMSVFRVRPNRLSDVELSVRTECTSVACLAGKSPLHGESTLNRT